MHSAPLDPIPEQARSIAAAFVAPAPQVRDILACAFEETTTLEVLARELEREPRLATRFLRLANCSFWGPGEQSTDLAQAIGKLGGGVAPYAALVVAVASILPPDVPARTFDVEAWLRRAWTRSVAALLVARTCHADYGAEVFAGAFLLEIGSFALAAARPAEHDALMEGAEAPGADLERRVFGCEAAAVGAALLEAWGAPALLCGLQRHAAGDADRSDDPELDALVQTVRIAEATVELFEREDKGAALTRIEERATRAFDLPPDVVYEFVSLLDGHTREVRRVFDARVPFVPSSSAPEPAEARDRGSRTRALRDSVLPPELEHRRLGPQDASLTDREARVPNRAAFERFLDREVEARLLGVVRSPMCVLVLSLEDFTGVHRERGAEEAGRWLAEAAATLKGRVRRGDLLARLGGSYFGVCMSEAGPRAMQLLSDRLREALMDPAREAAGQASSMAIGGACLSKVWNPDDGRLLLRSAVGQLRQALAQRGGVQLASTPISPPRAA